MTDAQIYRKAARLVFKDWDGEQRTIHKCLECGTVYGRRYIPYGLGQGLTVNACHCLLVSRNVKNLTLITSKGDA